MLLFFMVLSCYIVVIFFDSLDEKGIIDICNHRILYTVVFVLSIVVLFCSMLAIYSQFMV